jgi:hypothetical protein
MASLLSAPYTTFMAVVAFGLFAWLFWDLIEEIRDGGGGGTFRPTRRRREPRNSTGAAADSEFRAAPPPPPPGGREFLQFSRTLETWIDRETREPRGRVLTGGYRGRGLETLSRTDCLRLNDYCLLNDLEAARLLEAYLGFRFGGASRARPGEGRSRPRAPVDGAKAREDAYAALGLASGASDREVVLAHRALIKKCHPDHGGSTADAALINRAKDVLLENRG